MADAQSVPVIELPRRLRELDALKDRPVVLVCRMDRRSANAAALLTPPSTAAKAPAAGPPGSVAACCSLLLIHAAGAHGPSQEEDLEGTSRFSAFA
jgi:hypothetical protein